MMLTLAMLVRTGNSGERMVRVSKGKKEGLPHGLMRGR